MEPFVRRFIRSSLVWLAIGVVLGVAIAIRPSLLIYRAAHMHTNLLGFVSMMIFGVAYHVLPRFTGRPLHRRGLAAVHLWLANSGLTLMVGGWLLRPHVAVGSHVLVAGALLSAAGAFAFIYNIWRTLDAGVVQPAGLHPGPGRR